jgi:hypothetical protein
MMLGTTESFEKLREIAINYRTYLVLELVLALAFALKKQPARAECRVGLKCNHFEPSLLHCIALVSACD